MIQFMKITLRNDGILLDKTSTLTSRSRIYGLERQKLCQVLNSPDKIGNYKILNCTLTYISPQVSDFDYVRTVDEVGRIVLPDTYRGKLEIFTGNYVDFTMQNNSIFLRKVV